MDLLRNIVAAEPARDGAPVFVHAWWRSASTYVWSKLRRDPSLCCYYEPLNEQLASLNRAAVETPPVAGLSRALRHPKPEKHYFAEYADLIGSGRLHYSRDLAYARYLLAPGEADPVLHAYLSGLISAGSAARRRVVLCFCRSQMRSAWMKGAFGGSHVAQIRNPLDQWTSFQVHPYFTHRLITIALKLRASHPLAFKHVEPFERLAERKSHADSKGCSPGLFKLPVDDALSLFLVIWMASALQTLSCCDWLLDVDRLSSEPEYRRASSEWFGSIGCAVDFSDCTLPSGSGKGSRPARFNDIAEESVRAIKSGAAALVIASRAAVMERLPGLSPLSRELVKLAIEG